MIEEQLSFLEEYPAGIYRTLLLSGLFTEEELPLKYKNRFEGDLERAFSDHNGGYIQTPELFFQRWLNGRRSQEPKLNVYHLGSGFELQLPTIRTETVELDDGIIIRELRGLVIASDFGYTNDFWNDLVFAINDLSTQRVLVYRDENETIKHQPLAKKQLKPERIYGFPEGAIQEYPFESLNLGKSCDYTWTLVNISPDEVYKTLKEIEFTW